MSDDETKELYRSTDTAVFERMSVPEKLIEQRTYGKSNFKKIEKNEEEIKKINEAVTEIKSTAKLKAEIDTERHGDTTKSIDDLTTAIQKQKDDDALEETNTLKAKIAKFESGAEEKTSDNKKLLYGIAGAALVIILTRHLGDIVKMLSGG